MGTANFAIPDNASKYYVIDTRDNEYAWNDIRDEVASEFKRTSKKAKLDWYQDDKIRLDDNRSYPSTSIGTLDQNVDILPKGVDLPDFFGVNITYTIKTTSAYYEGATLDFEIAVENECYGTDDAEGVVDCLISEFEYSMEGNEDKLIAKKLNKNRSKMEGAINDAIDKASVYIEKVFANNTEAYTKAYQMSNGEAGYEKSESVIRTVLEEI